MVVKLLGEIETYFFDGDLIVEHSGVHFLEQPSLAKLQQAFPKPKAVQAGLALRIQRVGGPRVMLWLAFATLFFGTLIVHVDV